MTNDWTHVGSYRITGPQPGYLSPDLWRGMRVGATRTLKVRVFNDGPRVVSLVTTRTVVDPEADPVVPVFPTPNAGHSTMTVQPSELEEFELSAVHQFVGFIATIGGDPVDPDIDLRVDVFIKGGP